MTCDHLCLDCICYQGTSSRWNPKPLRDTSENRSKHIISTRYPLDYNKTNLVSIICGGMSCVYNLWGDVFRSVEVSPLVWVYTTIKLLQCQKILISLLSITFKAVKLSHGSVMKLVLHLADSWFWIHHIFKVQLRQ